MLNRREFIAASAGAVLAAPAFAAEAKKPVLRPAIKYSMIGIKGTVKDKFELVKKLGLQGVEIDAPSGLNLDDAVAAQKETGIKIHGVIDSAHWGKPLSSPDEKVRAEGLKALETALNAAAKVEADTVLLVPGVARDGVSYEQCYERSQAEIKKVLPLAEKLKVKICIETVWNDFITKPEQLISFVDDFKSPWVAAYFDISNMLKYGVPAAEWIRKLGKRMVKFDFKGWSKAKGFGAKIGEGDEDWPEVLKALGEVGYDGWATSEVGGGGEEHLQDITARMKKVLGLS